MTNFSFQIITLLLLVLYFIFWVYSPSGTDSFSWESLFLHRESLRGINPILEYIAQSSPSLHGRDAVESGHVCCDQVLAKTYFIIFVLLVF